MKLNLNIQNNLSDVINNIDSEIEAERTKLIEIEVLRDFVEILDAGLKEFADELDELWGEMGRKSEMGKTIVNGLKDKFEKKLREKRGLNSNQNSDLG